MTSTIIREFHPNDASGEDLDGYFQTRAAAVRKDTPDYPPLTYEAAIGPIQNPPAAYGKCYFWTAHSESGRVIGFGQAWFPTDENAGIARAEVLVHPEFRRRGIGIKLLDHMLDVIAAQKRGQLVGVCHAAGVGAAWCRGLGFEVTAATVVQELDICQVDGGLWEVPTPTGYRLDRWIGRVPDDLLESYAAARPAIRDAPLGQASYREADWTAARVRETEDDLIERGVHERVVVAIRNDSNDVVGVTGLLVYAHRPQFAYQNDTSVVSLHRGHGLGVAMKSAMMRWITQDRPELERVYTTTAAENNHMIRVNLQIGYQTRRSVTWVERPLEGLAELITR